MVLEYPEGDNLSIPVIVIGRGEFEGQLQVPNSLDLKLLIKTAATATKITAKEMMSKVVPNYFPIPILCISTASSARFVLCMPKILIAKILTFLGLKNSRRFDSSLITHMVQEGVTHLYVDKMDRLDFVNNVTSELISTLEAEISVDEQHTANDKNIEASL